MSIFSSIFSAQERKAASLKKALQSRNSKKKPSVTMLELVDKGIELSTVEHLLAKRKLPFYVREDGAFLRQLVKAKNDLDNGNPESVAALLQVGHDRLYFTHLTSGETTLAKIQAKEIVAEHFHNPSGDHGDPHFSNSINFALSQQHQAILGYAELGMEAECEKAMRKYADIDLHTGSTSKRLRQYMSGVVSPLSLAAIRVAQDMDILTAEDHIELIKKHPEDEQRARSVDFVVDDFTQRHKVASSYKQIDSDVVATLINHVKTPANNGDIDVTKSQFKAMDALHSNDAMSHFIDSQLRAKRAQVTSLREVIGDDINLIDSKKYLSPNLADEYFGTVITETQKANPAVLGSVFGSVSSTHHFLMSYIVDYEIQSNNNLNFDQIAALETILPSDLAGDKAAIARNHVADKLKKNAALSYTQTSNPLPVVYARIAANLSGDVLMDDSLPAHSMHKAKAKKLLNSLQEIESFAVNQARKNTEKFGHTYDENQGFGVANAMLETAEIVQKRNKGSANTSHDAPRLQT